MIMSMELVGLLCSYELMRTGVLKDLVNTV